MTTSTELVIVEKKDVHAVFTTQELLDPILQKIANEARSIVPDVTTKKGRDAIASVAYKVAQSKSYLDSLGKDLVAEMKELPKLIDAHRKYTRDFLDALKEEVRKPLTEWEEEQDRIEAQRKSDEEAKAAAEKKEADHELALLMDAEFNRVQAEKAARAEHERIEREQRIAAEAAEKASIEAEAKAQAERDAIIRREHEARLAQERAEREKAEAEQRAKDAEERAQREREEAVKREEQARLQAIEQEKARVAAEAAQAEKERIAREKDKNHRAACNNDALADLMAAGLPEDMAKAATVAIAKGNVRRVRIEY